MKKGGESEQERGREGWTRGDAANERRERKAFVRLFSLSVAFPGARCRFRSSFTQLLSPPEARKLKESSNSSGRERKKGGIIIIDASSSPLLLPSFSLLRLRHRRHNERGSNVRVRHRASGGETPLRENRGTERRSLSKKRTDGERESEDSEEEEKGKNSRPRPPCSLSLILDLRTRLLSLPLSL